MPTPTLITTRPAQAIAMAAVMLMGAPAAQADMTLAIPFLVATSAQTFSQDALDAYEVYGIVATPKGNAMQLDAATVVQPITHITFGRSKYVGLGDAITKGDAVGGALEISRMDPRGSGKIGLTLANFTIDYQAKRVLADTTPIGGVTLKQVPVYEHTVTRPMMFDNIKGAYVGREVLSNLRMTDEMKTLMVTNLKLPKVARSALNSIDFGTLTATIVVAFRTSAEQAKISVKPYQPN